MAESVSYWLFPSDSWLLCHCSQWTWPSRSGLSVSKQSQGGAQAVTDKSMPPELERATALGAHDHMQMHVAGECPSHDRTQRMLLVGLNQMLWIRLSSCLLSGCLFRWEMVDSCSPQISSLMALDNTFRWTFNQGISVAGTSQEAIWYL